MIDVNVSLFPWPTRRVPRDVTSVLASYLRASGVTQAWAGSFEGLLQLDLAGVNQRLAEECARHGDGLLIPVGTINPRQPDWEDDLRRCIEKHQMRMIRLYPNYHGYDLQSPEFARLLEQAVERHLIVQIMVRAEDPRTQHRLLQAADVALPPLIPLIPKFRELKLVLLNAQPASSAEMQAELVRAGQVYFDVAMLESVEGLTRTLQSVPPERILFGSHAPFFAWKASELKFRESELPAAIREQIKSENAVKLLASAVSI